MGSLSGQDARRFPRFKLDTDVRIRSPKSGFIPGQILEISESGLSVILPAELPVGETVYLEFRVPLGHISAQAVVRNRSTFRHGFEFLQPNPQQDLVRQSCGMLTRVS